MESLYVGMFSNGLIKVGRSGNPKARLVQHADRVSCLGVTLVESYVTECPDNDEGREQALINRCVQAASARFKLEWFAGLEFREVCRWAYEAARADGQEAPSVHSSGEPDFRALVNWLRVAGWRQSDIARECRCDQSCISDIANGKTKDPRYSIGASLLRLAEGISHPPIVPPRSSASTPHSATPSPN